MTLAMISIGKLDFETLPLLPKEGIEGWFNSIVFIVQTFSYEKIPVQPPPAPPSYGGECTKPHFIFSFLNKIPA